MASNRRINSQDVEDWLLINEDSNTRQHRAWIREEHSEDTREQDAWLAAQDREAFLGLHVMSPTGSIEITEANIGQLFNC